MAGVHLYLVRASSRLARQICPTHQPYDLLFDLQCINAARCASPTLLYLCMSIRKPVTPLLILCRVDGTIRVESTGSVHDIPNFACANLSSTYWINTFMYIFNERFVKLSKVPVFLKSHQSFSFDPSCPLKST